MYPIKKLKIITIILALLIGSFATWGVEWKAILIILGFAYLVFEIFEEIILQKSMKHLARNLRSVQNGKYNLKLRNTEDIFSYIEHELYKASLKIKEESILAQQNQIRLQRNLEDISHQIKTPITAMNLLLENLSQHDLSDLERKEILTNLQVETSTITDLVLNLLKLSKLESGTEFMSKQEISLQDLLNQAQKVLGPLIENHQAKIILQHVDVKFVGDPVWQQEVWINLIKNAVENNLSHEVVISAVDTATFLEVKITNLAESLPPEELNRIFERFYRRKSKTPDPIKNDASKNFGIGLNLCKAVIEADGGKIFVKMEKDHQQLTKMTFTVRYFKMPV